MLLEKQTLDILKKALDKLEEGFDLPGLANKLDAGAVERVLEEVASKMQNNYPYFHPLFVGQMLKPPHPIARAAYMLAMWINPNNHAMDGSKASSPMEKEVVADLASMFELDNHLGHLTSGGTMANLEALWVAGQIHPEKTVIASDQAHYTHERISGVLKLKFTKVASDRLGRMDLNHLEELLKTGTVGTVVCTMGTTGLGSVDPLDKILALQENYDFRIHADAAYGGYFRLLDNLESETTKNFKSLNNVDSIVIDPHKHGLQPYGCGCILFSDPSVASFYLHDSPYTYFTSDELHLGEISLECSRAGASAVGLWATHQLLPPVANGAFALDLSKSRNAALQLFEKLADHEGFWPIMIPETDIVVWAIAGKNTSEMSIRADAFFKKAEENHLYLSLYKYPTEKLAEVAFQVNSEYITCLRSCLMKPEHEDWLDQIWGKLIQTLKSL